MFQAILRTKDGKNVTDVTRKDMEKALQDESVLLWVDFNQPDDSDIDILNNVFKLHPLTVEDCILPNARPKLEQFPDYLFMNMFAIELHPDQDEEIKTVELDFCIGKNFVLTVRSDKVKSVATTRAKIIDKNAHTMDKGPDFLVCSIVDTMVDNYFPIIKSFDDRVDDVSDELFQEPTQDTLNRIYNLKNDVMFLRRTIGPQSDTITMLIRGNYHYVTDDNKVYFREVYDNLMRLTDVIGQSRDIITSALEAYTSVVSNRLNEVMKTLTVIATIAMPLTLIASIYGMNFKHMPELTSRYAYPLVIGSMAAVAVGMLYYFKRKKWL